MQKRLWILLAAVLLVSCGKTGNQETTETAPVQSAAPSAETAASAEPDSAVYFEYQENMNDSAVGDNYTAGVSRTYDMRYEDGSISVYDLDGVIEEADGNIHLTQHINADGIQSELDGWYDGRRLYMTYNTVNYYEEMNAESVRNTMLVDVEPCAVQENQIEQIIREEENGETVFTITLKQEAAKSLFNNRYDIYGLNAYEDYDVTRGTIRQKFDQNGVLLSETTEFLSAVRVNGIGVNITADTSVGWMNRGATEVKITDKQKSAFDEYVNFMDIDTDAISTADITSDLAEDTAEATLRKRLVNRLNYELQSDGTYLTKFNETESYRIDFANHVFTYSNRSSHYVYNWQGNQGGYGDACSVDFTNQTHTSGCDDTVIEQITNVRKYFLMELYYCGLSLDDLNEK